jgi:hypothetical protein
MLCDCILVKPLSGMDNGTVIANFSFVRILTEALLAESMWNIVFFEWYIRSVAILASRSEAS